MSITIRKGTREDLNSFVQLLTEVRAGMEHPEWFYVDPPAETHALMDKGILELWLAEENGKVVAVFDLLIAGKDTCNYGCSLGFSEAQLMRTVNMDSVAVHPDYRGRGLQRRLLQTAEEWLLGQGEWTLLCTIHPDNRFSLNNALLQGYETLCKMPMYGSVRYFLKKTLKK